MLAFTPFGDAVMKDLIISGFILTISSLRDDLTNETKRCCDNMITELAGKPHPHYNLSDFQISRLIAGAQEVLRHKH